MAVPTDCNFEFVVVQKCLCVQNTAALPKTFQKTFYDWTWALTLLLQCSVLPSKTAGRVGSMWERDGRSSWIVESVCPVAMVNTVELWRRLCRLRFSPGLFLFLLEMTNRKTLWLRSCATITATIAHPLAHHHSSNRSSTLQPRFHFDIRRERAGREGSILSKSPFVLLRYEQLKPNGKIYQSFG